MKPPVTLPLRMLLCLDMPPTNRPRIVKRGLHSGMMKPAKLSAWLTGFYREVRDGYGICPGAQQPIDGAVRVRLLFVRKRPTWLKPKSRPDGMVWCTASPDVDNSAKVILDGLTDVGLWKDDSGVCSLTVEKAYCERDNDPGIEVIIERVEGDGPLSLLWTWPETKATQEDSHG